MQSPQLDKKLWRIQFTDPDLERSWQIARLPIFKRYNVTGAIIFAGMCAVFLVADIVAIGSPTEILLARCVAVLSGALAAFTLHRVTNTRTGDRLVLVGTSIALAFMWGFVFGFLPEPDVRAYWLAGGVLTISSIFVLFDMPLQNRVFLAFVALVVSTIMAFFLDLPFRDHVIAAVHCWGAIVIGWVGAWQVEQSRRVAFWEHHQTEVLHAEAEAAKSVAEREKKRADDLLRNILPGSIADLLLSHRGTIARRHPDVTVLFADLVGFTPMSARLEAEEVVDRLDAIFTSFDALCDTHQVEKIKTIGDAYMVAAGVPGARQDHAVAIVDVAMGMIEAVERTNAELNTDLELRIGAHSGPVVAGVIGKRKFIYDLWGDTVNTASRMESHGVAGRVHISDVTAELLGDRFELESRGLIEIKGKGPMPTFLVKRPAASVT